MMTFADPGPLPELAWLPVEKLRVNLDYQRIIGTPRSQALIHQIAQDFHWLAFQSIQATPDGEGGWYVIDGQHRVEAARRRGFAHVPATVVAAATVAEQAGAFVQANRNRIPINQFAVFHALVTSGDPAAKQLAAICKRAEIAIPRSIPSAADMPPGMSLAIGTLLTLARKHGPLARLPIEAVAASYRETRGALRAPFFDGAARYIFAAPPEQRDEAAGHAYAYFASTSPDQIFAMVAANIGQGGAGSRGKAIAELIGASAPRPRKTAAKAPPKPAPKPAKKIAVAAVKAKAPTIPKPTRPSSAPFLKPVIRKIDHAPDEDAAIAAFIAKQGVTTAVDFGAHQPIVDAARNVAWEVTVPRNYGGQRSRWQLNGAQIDTRELYRRVNAELERRGKKPIPEPKVTA